ncbi:MAG: single-stranded DNA-binding protein [Eubacteriales bacterium]|nr:single-stranded DNA-binding protein [Eubacteriales bacterium]
MATHNQVRLVGFLKVDPILRNVDVAGEEQAIFSMCVIHRPIENYHNVALIDVLVLCTEAKLVHRMKKLKQFDLIELKGFYNISTGSLAYRCRECGAVNRLEGKTRCYVYPIWFNKIDSLKQAQGHEENLPEKILKEHFQEVSNEAFIIGNVVDEPEVLSTGKNPCCRYQVAIERKYHVRSQSDIRTDFPYIYSYGKQALSDMIYLKQGALIMADCFIRNRSVKMKTMCTNCEHETTYQNVASELVPYSVEYLRGHYTPEEAEKRRQERGLDVG